MNSSLGTYTGKPRDLGTCHFPKFLISTSLHGIFVVSPGRLSVFASIVPLRNRPVLGSKEFIELCVPSSIAGFEFVVVNRFSKILRCHLSPKSSYVGRSVVSQLFTEFTTGVEMKKSRTRRLGGECLESRQLLHGGGLGAALGAATVDEQVEAVFERFDATEDGILNEADELSDRVTERLSGADADADGSVTMNELTVFYETSRVSRLLGVGESSGRHSMGTGDAADRIESAIEVVDDDGEGDIDQAEVSEELWAAIGSADVDGDSSLSSDELTTLVETLDAERQTASITDKVDSIFARYDANEDGSLVEDEVSEQRWGTLVEADADADAAVSHEELTTYVTAQVEAGESPRDVVGGGQRGGGHGRGGRGR